MRNKQFITILLITILFSFTINSKQIQKVSNLGVQMNITSISFSGSNPSMGPYNQMSSNTLNMTTYPDELKALLDDTLVNGVISLRKYLKLLKEKNHDEILKVESAYDPGRLNSGQRIIDLNFSFSDGTHLSLRDLRTFSLRGLGYQSFESLIREKGTKYEEPDESKLDRPELTSPAGLEREENKEIAVPPPSDVKDDI